MKRVRFANVIAVSKWWYKSIYMFVFSQYFLLNVHQLNESIYIWNCSNQAQFFKQKINHEVSFRLKYLHKIFYNSQFKKMNWNSTHSYNRNIWVDISSHIIFLCLYKHSSKKMAEVSRDGFSLINWSSYLINFDQWLMFLSDNVKFSIINLKLANPNNERKHFIIKQ